MKFKALYILPLVLLFGCNKVPEQQSVETKTNNRPAVTRDALTITVGTTGRGAPLNYKNEQGVLEGIDIDIVRTIAEREGFKVEFVETEWANLFDKVESGDYDMAASSISWSAERESKYSLSDAYYFNPAAALYKTNRNINPKTIDDLKNSKVSVLSGSNYEKMLQGAGVNNLTTTQRSFESFSELMRDNVDVYVSGELNLKILQMSYAKEPLAVTPLERRSGKDGTLVMMVNKNKPELLVKLNRGIAKLKAEGEIEKIAQKHLVILAQAEANKNK